MLTIEGLGNIGILREVRILKKVNEVSSCSIKYLLEKELDFKNLKGLLNKDIYIEENGKTIVMRGFVHSLNFEKTFGKLILNVNVLSYSHLMKQVNEEKKPLRVFQSTSKTFSQIVEKLKTENYSINISDSETANKKFEKLLVQDNISDFDFVLNLAFMNNLFFFDDDISQKQNTKVVIGKDFSTKKGTLNSEEVIISNYYIDENVENIEIKARKYFDFGSHFDFEGFEFVIIGFELFYENQTEYYKYYLSRELKKKTFPNLLVSKELGRAKVISNEDPENKGRLQVEFLDYKDELFDERIWIPYITNLTEKDCGVFYFPDKDEIVYIYLSNSICYANGCVREIAINDDYKDLTKRSVAVRKTRNVITEKKIEIDALGFETTIEKEKLHTEVANSYFNFDENTVNTKIESEIGIKSKKIQLEGNSKVNIKTSALNID